MPDFLNPSEVLKKLKLRKNMIAADFGCGSGGWTIPLAKILKEGKVYAIDILEEPLSALRTKVKIEKLFNIEIRKANLEKGTTLLSDSCDLILMTNLLFECEDKKQVLEEGKRILKPGGEILVVDWIKDNPLTPEIEWVDFEEIKKIAEELNLKLEKEFEAGAYHYGLIFKKE
ncbi:MAG: class I SAM-dependent methyltransferase [Patescibacteria group bacterium]|nr:class I SAM-dependent methyltransferase [Patescibacteria group bacterium]